MQWYRLSDCSTKRRCMGKIKLYQKPEMFACNEKITLNSSKPYLYIHYLYAK